MKLIPRNYFLDDMFDDFKTMSTSSMKCDVYEENGIYNIEVDIPGFKKDEIKIESKDGYLTITAEKNEEENEKNKNYIFRERRYGKYERTFNLGNLKADDISAKFENGILKIKVPKIEDDLDKKLIEIE